MRTEERFDNISNGGETVYFFTCKTCGASVQRQDRDLHNERENAVDEMLFQKREY